MHCTLTQDQIDKAVAFHGHECPGLWIGLRRVNHGIADPALCR